MKTTRPAIERVYPINGHNVVRLSGDLTGETVYGALGKRDGYVHEFHAQMTEIKPPYALDLTGCRILGSDFIILLADAYRTGGHTRLPVICDSETSDKIKLKNMDKEIVKVYSSIEEMSSTSSQSGQTEQA